MSHMVGNPEDRFSRVAAHFFIIAYVFVDISLTVRQKVYLSEENDHHDLSTKSDTYCSLDYLYTADLCLQKAGSVIIGLYETHMRLDGRKLVCSVSVRPGSTLACLYSHRGCAAVIQKEEG